MDNKRIKLGIIGLGRWAKVLTKAAKTSSKFSIEVGFSRSEKKNIL